MSADLCIEHARSLLNVKWRHLGRSPMGVDCIGLIVLSVAAGGIAMRDRRNYGREPWQDNLRKELLEHFGNPVDELAPGDIVLMKWENQPAPAHVGIVGDYVFGGLSLIHAYSQVSVTEHRIDKKWQARIIEGYRPWRN